MRQPTPFYIAPDGVLADACSRALVLPCDWPTDARSRKIAAANAREIAGLFARLDELEAFRGEVETVVAERKRSSFSDFVEAYDGQEEAAEKQANALENEISVLESRVKELEGK